VTARKIITGVLAAVALLIATSVYWYSNIDSTHAHSAQIEILKFLLQMVAVSGIGTFASLVVDEFKRDRQQQLAKMEFAKQAIDECVRAYAIVKLTRRLMRARCEIVTFAKNGTVEPRSAVSREAVEVFDAQMEDINQAQLSLEALGKRVQADAAISARIEDKLKPLEKYLGELIDEYEKLARKLRGGENGETSDIKRLGDFLGPYRQSLEFRQFSEKYHQTISELQKIMLGLS
jgi:hypothetical protein